MEHSSAAKDKSSSTALSGFTYIVSKPKETYLRKTTSGKHISAV